MKKAKTRKATLTEIIADLCDRNPEFETNQIYLLFSVWEAQGLKLYPYQRDKLLSGELARPDAVVRQLRRLLAAKASK